MVGGFGHEEGADPGVMKSHLLNLGDREELRHLGRRGGNTGEELGLGRKNLGGNRTHQSVMGTDPRAPRPRGRPGVWGNSQGLSPPLTRSLPIPTCPLTLLIAAVQSDLG